MTTAARAIIALHGSQGSGQRLPNTRAKIVSTCLV